MATENTLWLIDDDPALRLVLEDTFADAGLSVVVFASAKGAWTKLNDVLHGHEELAILPDVILTDIRMPMMDGLSFSDWVHKNFPDLPIIIMTAHSDLKSAVDSYQTGAFEYLAKPFDLDDAVLTIKKAIKPKINTTKPHITKAQNNKNSQSDTIRQTAKSQTASSTEKRNDVSSTQVYVNESLEPSFNKPLQPKASISNHAVNDSPIIGQSVAMQTVFRAIGRLSTSPITVLITGESGTGKELVAQALHQNSPRCNKQFVALNMAAIPHDLIESELFGHEKGAFTGATSQRPGRFEQADGGTLFLDEIGDMPYSTQTRLLRVLANGEFFRVGGLKPIKVNVRIIAATHQNLEQLVKEGKFREDLFYRLNVIRLPLPPLRARPDDIPELVRFFMDKAATEMATERKQLSEDALHIMQAFSWPGNVRQLENACRWITVMATGNLVMIDDLPPELTDFARRYLHNYSETGQLATGIPLSISPDPMTTSNIANPWTQEANLDLNASSNQQQDFAGFIEKQPVSLSQAPITDSARWQKELQDWAGNALRNGQHQALQNAIPNFERALIEVALQQTKGRKGEAAELLGWGRNTLTRKIKLLQRDD